MTRIRCIPAVVSLLTIMVMAGCAHTPVAPIVLDMGLWHGEVVFGHEVQPAPEADMLSVSAEMADFLSADIVNPEIPYTRFRRLMRGLQDGGYFANSYAADGTFSAAETFSSGKGNCLGYTNMFIALARAAGLDARYQLVEAYPNWDVEGGYLVKNNHVNVIVDKIRLTRFYEDEVVVDFNLVRPDPEYSTAVVISDEFAAALFHANLAVQQMHAGNLEGAFSYLKRAAYLEPRNKVVWNNLGVLLSRLKRPQLAQRAYEQVLRLEPRDKTAWVGMAVALAAQGRYAEALVYNKRVERYQARNPYYHYAMAHSAFAKQDFSTALASVEAAIDLSGREAKFYQLRAATAEQLGDKKLMQRSAVLASKYSKGEVRTANPTAVYRYD